MVELKTDETSDDLALIEVKDGVGRLIMNRPGAMNALNRELVSAMLDALEALAANPDVRVVLLEGAGRAFCAGGDLEFLDKISGMSSFEVRDHVYSRFGAFAKRLKTLEKPTVAAVQGAAMGAGMDIALNCDFRVAASNALFQETWINLGLITPLGGMYVLPRLIGFTKAQEMLMLGRKVKGPEAAEIGLVNETVELEDLADTAWKWAKRLADGPPLALRAMKEGIRRGTELPLADEWEHNIYVQSLLLGSEDFANAVTSIKKREAPTFKGK